MKNITLSLLATVIFLGMSGMVNAQDQSAQYLQAANTSYGSGNYDQAISYYQAALQGNPNAWQADQGLGNCYYAKGQYNDALTFYNKALGLNPNNPSLSSFVQTLQAKVGASAPAASPAPMSVSTPSPTVYRSQGSSPGKFELDPEAGVALGLSAGYGFGFGGSVFGGIPMQGGLVIGGEVGFFTFSGPSSSTDLGPYGTDNESSSEDSIEIMAAAKYRFGQDSLKPFLIGGAGISDITLSDTTSGLTGIYSADNGTTSSSGINPMVMGGGGVEFAAGKGLNIYGEARLSIVIGNGGTFTYVPVLAGLSLDL